jgi:hypothetical protein
MTIKQQFACLKRCGTFMCKSKALVTSPENVHKLLFKDSWARNTNIKTWRHLVLDLFSLQMLFEGQNLAFISLPRLGKLCSFSLLFVLIYPHLLVIVIFLTVTINSINVIKISRKPVRLFSTKKNQIYTNIWLGMED